MSYVDETLDIFLRSSTKNYSFWHLDFPLLVSYAVRECIMTLLFWLLFTLGNAQGSCLGRRALSM